MDIAAEAVVAILRFIGENPDREGLKDTPKRVSRAWVEMTAGYSMNVAEMFMLFEDVKVDEMVVLKDLEFVSCCEHHMMPFQGVAHIGYIPNGKVIGISKLARVLEVYTRRLQIQERICEQVTAALDTYLQPLGSACVLEATHCCMSCRGVRKQNAVMITSSLTGAFYDKPEARHEFLNFIR